MGGVEKTVVIIRGVDREKKNVLHIDVAMSDEEMQCAICLDNVQPRTKRTLDCAHVFHDYCIAELLRLDRTRRTGSKCPICRKPIEDPLSLHPSFQSVSLSQLFLPQALILQELNLRSFPTIINTDRLMRVRAQRANSICDRIATNQERVMALTTPLNETTIQLAQVRAEVTRTSIVLEDATSLVVEMKATQATAHANSCVAASTHLDLLKATLIARGLYRSRQKKRLLLVEAW